MKKIEILLLGLAFFIGIILRLLLFNQTDITWDEAWNVMLAFKIFIIFETHFFILLSVIIISILFFYVIAIKRNLIFTIVIGIIAILIKFIFNIPVVIHERQPLLFNFLTSIGLFFVDSPDVSGKLVSLLSMLSMPFIAYFFVKKVASKKAAIISFVLISLSPLSIFYSSVALLTPLAIALAFLSLTIFVYGIEKNKLMPISGIIFSFAIMTRYTVLLLLPIFVFLIYWNKTELLKKKNLNNTLIFGIIVLTTLIIFLPSIFASYSGFLNWDISSGNKLIVNDFEHYSSFIVNKFDSYPIQPTNDFYLKTMSIFLSPVILLLFLVGTFFVIKEKNIFLILIALLFFAYLLFFSLQSHFQPLRYLIELEFPLILIASIGLAKLPTHIGRKIIFSLLIIFFLLQSTVILNTHNFTGLSDNISKISINSKIYTDILDPVRFYRGDYLIETQVTNPFFSKFFKQENEIVEKRLFYYRTDKLSEVASEIDYIVLSESFFFDNNNEVELIEKMFNKCKEIIIDKHTLLTIYAKEKCINN